VELELVESIALLEWLANNYKGFGATLEIITDKSQEGAQFVRGFGGIGGKYRVLCGVEKSARCNLNRK
jgi:peptide chain release factor subunit 1